MIEFTMSRVCMSICGLVLLAAVIVPVTGMYDSKTVTMESGSADDIAKLIDSFHYSETETFTAAMSDILPNSSSYMELKGHTVILTTERGTYRAAVNADIVIKDGIVFGHGDIIVLTKADGAVIAEKIA